MNPNMQRTTIRHRYPQAVYRWVALSGSPQAGERNGSLRNGVSLAGVGTDAGAGGASAVPVDDEEEEERAENWHDRWNDVVSSLPPQINKQQINMISIGGAIGTGLFLATNPALLHGGPVGLVFGYMVMGSVVYCTVLSFGEMVAFQPHIGGPVGLAHMYVDEALAFALGWNAWYNWTIVLPAEISAATMLMNYWTDGKNAGAYTGVFMLFAILVNCLGTAWYGRLEVGFTRVKVLTIISLILLGLVIDLGGSRQGYIGFSNWVSPGPFNGQMFASGHLGEFLGFFSVLLQAAFSFFGSEVPAIAAGEVINAGKNIPLALRWIWIRITLFYVLGVFIISLLVPYNDPHLLASTDGTGNQSPFIIALNKAGYAGLPHVFNAAFLLSAWSAASSDIYISSRFMFNLARLGHAPKFMGYLFRPWGRGDNKVAIPWVGILAASIVSVLAFMPDIPGASATVFSWLSSMTSAAALQAWIGILFTYIRWYKGTMLSIQRKQNVVSDFNRSKLQPYAAYYAFTMCIMVLVFNGWAVFVTQWRLALRPNETWPPSLDQAISGVGVIPTFITSYLPIPLFLLLLFGYKLVYRTKMVHVESMPSSLNYSRFDKPIVPEPTYDFASMPWPKRIWYYMLSVLS